MSIPNAPAVETHGMHINDLYDEAKGILDGAGVQSEADEAMVGKLVGMAREAKKAADEQRAIEKRPHDDAAKAVQAAWKPLVDKCDRIADTCKAALQPWLIAKQAEQDAAAAEARDTALKAQAEAQAALAAAKGDDLGARDEAERLLKEAGKASKDAARLDKARPLAATGGRSIGLRTAYTPDLIDAAAALRFYRETQPEALKEWLLGQARRDVANGARNIPGFNVNEERKAA
ncbi:MAG TPA: hypothetical protein VF637_10340 [Sphingomicrobium sp.]